MKPVSPSAAARWIACPASHYISQELPPLASTNAADEGTLAHAFAAYALHQVLTSVFPDAKQLETAPEEPETALATEEMLNGASDYADSVASVLMRHGGAKAYGIELPLIGFDGRAKGRADFVAVTADNTIVVVDYKFGETPVPAVNNPQLSVYALLAEQSLPHTPNPGFIVGIVQPRAVTSDFMPFSAVWDAPEIDAAFYSNAIKTAYEASADTLRTPGPHCQYCPARSTCLASVAERLLLACTAAGEAERAKDATDEQIGRWLTAVKAVDKVADDLARIAKARIGSGANIPGWRISTRRKQDWAIESASVDEQARELAEVLKVTPEQLIKKSLKTPAEMKKTLPEESVSPLVIESVTTALIACKGGKNG